MSTTTDQKPLDTLNMSDQAQDTPLVPPPEGMGANYTSDRNDGLALAVTSICLVASTLAIFVRIFCLAVKKNQNLKAGVHDLFILAAYAVFVAYAAVYYIDTMNHGQFIHVYEVTLGNAPEYLYTIYITQNLYLASSLSLKVALPLSFRSLFPGKGNHITCYCILALSAAYLTGSIIAVNLSCRPIRAFWDMTAVAAGGTCFPFSHFEFADGILHLVSDLALFVLSQVLVWSGRRKGDGGEGEKGKGAERKKKGAMKIVGMVAVVGLGLFACASAAARLAAVIQSSGTVDFTYKRAPICLWDMAELTCGFLIFCLPSVVASSPPSSSSSNTDEPVVAGTGEDHPTVAER